MFKMAIKMLDSSSFVETINCGKLVLVDFFATWCGPCKMLAPVLEEISEELPETRMIAKLDIDKNVDLARKYGVMSVPTMIAFKNGNKVELRLLNVLYGIQHRTALHHQVQTAATQIRRYLQHQECADGCGQLQTRLFTFSLLRPR